MALAVRSRSRLTSARSRCEGGKKRLASRPRHAPRHCQPYSQRSAASSLDASPRAVLRWRKPQRIGGVPRAVRVFTESTQGVGGASGGHVAPLAHGQLAVGRSRRSSGRRLQDRANRVDQPARVERLEHVGVGARARTRGRCPRPPSSPTATITGGGSARPLSSSSTPQPSITGIIRSRQTTSGVVFRDPLERHAPVGGEDRPVAVALDRRAKQQEQVGVVVDGQDGGALLRWFRHAVRPPVRDSG